MSFTIEPKFISFLQVSFDKNWQATDDRLFDHDKIIMRQMAKFRANVKNASVTILDMSYKIHKIRFRETAAVGIGNGVIYFDSQTVIDTKIEDAPAEYTTPQIKDDEMR